MVQRKSSAQGGGPATAVCLVPSLSNSSPFTAQPLCVPAPLHAAKAFTTSFSSAALCWGAFHSQALYVWEKGRGPCLHFKDIVKEHRGLMGWSGQIPHSHFSLSLTNSPFLTFLNSASCTLNKLFAQQTLELLGLLFFHLLLDFFPRSLSGQFSLETHTHAHTRGTCFFRMCSGGEGSHTPVLSCAE